jgi:serine acetyltransferase
VSDVAQTCVARGHRRFATLRSELCRDVDRLLRHVHRDTAETSGWLRHWGAALTPQLLAVLLHRIAHCLYANRRQHAATLVARFNFLLHRIDIDPSSCIAGGCLLPHPPGVSFLGSAGSDLTLYALCACVADPEHAPGGGPVLGNRVTLGGHAIVLGSAKAGDDVKVGPHVRVTCDIPAGTVVVSRNIRAARFRPIHASTAAAKVAGTASDPLRSGAADEDVRASRIRDASDT